MDTLWNETGISKCFIGELQRFCMQEPKIEKIILFGSRARGEHHRTSDIDIAIFTKGATYTMQNLIENTIHEMTTHLKMDVLFINRLTEEKLIANIRKEGVVIYEQGKALREA